ncbi:acyl-CoA dehydrogenase family protein [Allorhizocola rhizosphaerae]|uniref:acyl-CoA dehydrogenase family protein n=1 Tax=Allorhizocola rhizosphaerae TaxID=1872709 RepID=UPI000E3DBC85|nr:acyl-CoA dehydrogenase family protein [Allorhizocola rhizosphaerae]
MPIEWTEEQQRWRRDIGRWCDQWNAGRELRERNGTFGVPDWDLVRRSNVLRMPFDAAWGGLGLDLLTTMFVLEGLGTGCHDTGLLFSAVTHVVSTGIPLQRFGSAELRQTHLKKVCEGSVIGAHAITEPTGGSDATNMRTTAVRENDSYVLNGQKSFITNGPVADLFVVYARTDTGPGPFGLSAFLVERDTPGFTVGPALPKMGLLSSPLCELELRDCRVPAANLIGRPGTGFLIIDHVMTWEILCSFIVTVGRMQQRLDRCIAHARERVQFGQPIASFQSISHRIVEMKIGLENSRRWLYETAYRFGRHHRVTEELAIAKLIASESNLASALAAVQIFGGRGYLTESGVEGELRDAVAGTIYSGTSEIQRERIARMLGL